jgi:hypothetical protein
MRCALRFLLLPLVFLAALAPLPQQAVRAEADQYGYVWSAYFPFENDLNGVLTLKVGPWKNGKLDTVDATSTTPVSCVRIGNVSLNAGDAVFNGGYLRCTVDIGAAVLANHGHAIPAVDTYQSILFAASLQTSALTHAPIFTADDARYTVDFSNLDAVRMTQDLENDLGVQEGIFPGLNGFTKRTYQMTYSCAWLGACGGNFRIGLQSDPAPVGGVPISFATGPQSFLIGGDGATTFQGRMGSLLIDPGNTVH